VKDQVELDKSGILARNGPESFRPGSHPEPLEKSMQGKMKDVSLYCPHCGIELTGNHCKLICLRCHYFMSCSDYY
jgi:hypothetical protein